MSARTSESADVPVQKMYMDAKIFRRSQTNADQAATLASLPLMNQPGTKWEYGRLPTCSAA